LHLCDTIRAALAPAARACTVFNLAWYEVLSILLILAGQGLQFRGYGTLCIGVQSLNIIAVAIIVVALHAERKQLLEALALLSLLVVVGLTFGLQAPICWFAIVLVMFLPLIWVIPTWPLYLLVASYGVMFIPIIASVAHQKLSRYELGLTGGLRLMYLIPFGIFIGVGLGFIEYSILVNKALIVNGSISQLIQLSMIMVFFVALVEELLFRVLLQTQLIERIGAIAGVLLTSVIFSAMHSGYTNVYELLFTFGASVVFGVAFCKTKSLPFVVTMHAVDDILVFGVLPFLPSLALTH
jgi:membrane protease YdiL (CAAX protease family)